MDNIVLLQYQGDSEIMAMILAIVICLAIISVFPIIIASVAKKKGRSWIGWFFITLFLRPVFSLILLLALGDTDKKRKEKIAEDERIRKRIS